MTDHKNNNQMLSTDIRLSLISIWAPLLSMMLLVMIFGDHWLRDHLCLDVLAPALGVSTSACHAFHSPI